MFQISLHERDLALLIKIKEFFGVGEVINRKDGVYYYKVSKLSELMIIVIHFNKYPLITEKWVDFELFKQVLELMSNKEHLTEEGLLKIVNIKASMNFENISSKLKEWFPDIKPVNRPIREELINIKPEWLSGFVEGEGCFTVNIYKKKESVLGKGVKLVFKITQDNRNLSILEKIVEFLGCGRLYSQSKIKNSRVTDFMVTGLIDIVDKVIPFFLAHPLHGVKKNELLDFIKVTELMKEKSHLTKEGLAQIQKIKEEMNTKRLR